MGYDISPVISNRDPRNVSEGRKDRQDRWRHTRTEGRTFDAVVKEVRFDFKTVDISLDEATCFIARLNFLMHSCIVQIDPKDSLDFN